MSSSSVPGQQLVRQSHGLEQFFSLLGDRPRLQVLDLGEFTQANVQYITNLGHRLTSEDMLRTADTIFGPGDPAETQADPGKREQFLDQVLQYGANHFDAVLVWDAFEHMSPPLVSDVIERLTKILRPQGLLLACFHADAPSDKVETFSFRIADGKTLLLIPRGARRLAQCFSNRAVERLFERFQSVKFFLTRDYLREVIVRK